VSAAAYDVPATRPRPVRPPYRVPDSIPISKVRAFVAELGIPAEDLRDFTCGVSGVYVEVYARDKTGQKYYDAGSGSTAVHRISIPLDRTA
jgi:hypothetical protein